MKLVGTYISPYARRVAAALISRAIAYEHEDLNGYANPARARELNPVGKVPVLVLDNGERLIDSAAILDYIDELVGPERALIPRSGAARRTALRLSAISTTICEQITAHHFERQRPGGSAQADLIERYRQQAMGGLRALDAASAGWPDRREASRHRHHQRRRRVRVRREMVPRSRGRADRARACFRRLGAGG